MSDEEMQLNEAELNELVQHLKQEEQANQEATLSSMESFQMWVMEHPALRQMAISDSIAQIGPAILTFLQQLLGLR